MADRYARCAGCGKERQMSGAKIKKHNRWDGTRMVPCPGSGKPPSAAPASVFRGA